MTNNKITHKSFLLTVLTNLAIHGSVIVTGIITARILLPMGRGELATIILWPTILGTIGLMGTNYAIARETACHPEEEADLACTVMVMAIPLAGFFMALGYFLLPLLLPGDKHHLIPLTCLYLLFIPINLLRENLIALDQGRLRWARYNLIRFSWYVPYFIMVIGIWIAHLALLWLFLLAMLISNLATVILRIFLQRQEIRRGRISLQKGLMLLRQGFPFFLGTVAAVIALRVDMALSVTLLSVEGVGYYAVALSFASAHGALGNALGVTSFAALANEYDPQSQGRYLTRTFRQAVLLYAGLAIAMVFLAPLFIVPLFGIDFKPAVKPAMLLALATPMTALSNMLLEGMKGMGSIFPAIGAQLLGSATLALSAWILVPQAGLMGMAEATLLGSLVFLLSMVCVIATSFRLGPSHFWAFRRDELRILYHRILGVFTPLKEYFTTNP